jgi:holliday junction DNA helicase RuvB
MKDSLRPTTLDAYVGQKQIKEVLAVSLEAARQRKEPLDHVLLNGPPGLGKTTLALIIANTMGWKMFPWIGSQLDRSISLTLLIIPAKQAIIFIDEVHRVRKPIQELLYPVLEDGKSPNGVPLIPLTIIGATTAIGKLEQPFVDRFGLQFQLEYYTDEELAQVVTASATKLKVSLEPDAISEVAKRGRGTPRIANNLLKRLRDFAQVQHISSIPADFAIQVLWEKLHVDDLGLQDLDRQYLQVLTEGGMGIEAIASKLHQDIGTVEDFIEPFLLSRDLILRGRVGRSLTDKGLEWINRN